MKQRISSSLHTAWIAATPFAAVAEEANEIGIEGRYVGNTIVDLMDTAGRAMIHRGNIEQPRRSAFGGMVDGDKKGTRGVFINGIPIIVEMRAAIRSDH